MELRHIRYFVAVAEAGTFSGAAGLLRVSQPALSKQVRDLEEEIGADLFSRHSVGVQLTAAGRAFRKKALEILAGTDAAVKSAREAERGGRGVLRIGVVGVLVSNFLPKVVEMFHAAYPDVEIELSELNFTASEKFAALADGRIDVALAAFSDDAVHQRMGNKVIMGSKFFIAMHDRHALASHASLGLAELTTEAFLCLALARQRTCHADRVSEVFKFFNLPTPRVKVVESYETLVALVIGGQGITLVPPLAASCMLPGITLRPIKESGPILNLQIHAVWNEDRLENGTRQFIEVMEKALENGGKDGLAEEAKVEKDQVQKMTAA